jgi:hypothetical protein
MEWPPSERKMLNIVNIFLLYIGGCLISVNVWVSILVFFIGGTLILSDIGDLLKEKEEKRRKIKQEREEMEEKELGFHPVY